MIAPLKFDEILKVLVDHGVEFILVGGVAAVLEGVPLSTSGADFTRAPSFRWARSGL
jgi:hypothetical protein